MANFKALAASIFLSFAVSVFTTPVARKSFFTHPVTKTSANNITATVAKDQARLSKFSSEGTSSSTATNKLDNYVADVKVGSQTVSTILLFRRALPHICPFPVLSGCGHRFFQHLGWCWHQVQWGHLHW